MACGDRGLFCRAARQDRQPQTLGLLGRKPSRDHANREQQSRGDRRLGGRLPQFADSRRRIAQRREYVSQAHAQSRPARGVRRHRQRTPNVIDPCADARTTSLMRTLRGHHTERLTPPTSAVSGQNTTFPVTNPPGDHGSDLEKTRDDEARGTEQRQRQTNASDNRATQTCRPWGTKGGIHSPARRQQADDDEDTA